jgi:lysine biosynthesis protein LysW
LEGQELRETRAIGECPVCGGKVIPQEPVEESEIITCSECLTSIVVDAVHEENLVLAMAPQEEEDWGQ